jgi:hypothetical protein
MIDSDSGLVHRMIGWGNKAILFSDRVDGCGLSEGLNGGRVAPIQ